MSYLIDTHILLWFIKGDERCNDKIKAAMQNAGNIIFVSKVSLWEIVIKKSLNKLSLNLTVTGLIEFLRNHDFNLIEIEDSHLTTLLHLPFHHRDPFDRMIISQAISNNLTVITNDGQFLNYQVSVFDVN